VDRRDERTWIAIELTRQGEQKVEDGSLEDTLRTDLGIDEDFPVFVPATTYVRDGRTITIQLIEGYVFVASGLHETVYFALENKVYVGQVMSITKRGSLRTLSVIPDVQVQTMQTRLREMVSADILPDTPVRILEGRYRNLEGYVLDTENDQAIVNVELRSLWAIITVPLVFLETLGDDEPLNEEPDELEDDEAAEQSSEGRRYKFTARHFHDDVVAVIGELTNYEPGAFVSMEEVMPRVIAKKGLDPDNLPKGWLLRGVDGIYRRVGYAFRNQRADYCKIPKTLQGEQRGMWGLTKEGVILAKEIKKGDTNQT
jgi:transcription antitermination factor NusG